MTHTIPVWLRRVFLDILPRLLWMESPKLRQKREEYKRSLSMNNTDQSVIFQNPVYTVNETHNNRQKTKSKNIDKVTF